MRYIYFSCDNDKYWLELDDDSYATRQIILSDDLYHFSCIEDCLAEGVINDKELADDIVDISLIEFDTIWKEVLKEYNDAWNKTKEKYKIGDSIIGNLKYYYPQGAIFISKDTIINYKGTKNVAIHSDLEMRIIGYDETNMWVITEQYSEKYLMTRCIYM